MGFPYKCGGCGHVNQAELSQVGKKSPCGGCGKLLKVPLPRETAAASSAAPAVVSFTCPACGRKYTTKPELAGKKIRCSGCGGGVRVPQAAASASEAAAAGAVQPSRPSSRPALKTFNDGMAQAAPAQAPAKPATQRTAPVAARWDDDEDDGSAYSLLDDVAEDHAANGPKAAEPVLPSRSEVLEKARQQAAQDEAAAPKKKKRKKKKQTGFFNPKDTLILVGCVLGFVGVLAFFAFRFPDFRFPLGGFLCVVGFITYLLGAASLRQLVAEEGVFNLMLYRFFPPYQWWFVISRWSETKDYFAFFASGLMILGLGGFIIKESPTGKKAEASEKAFQRAQEGPAFLAEAGVSDDEGAPPAPAAGRASPPAPGAAAQRQAAPGGPQGTQRRLSRDAEGDP
jgi:hypothetical protein